MKIDVWKEACCKQRVSDAFVYTQDTHSLSLSHTHTHIHIHTHTHTRVSNETNETWRETYLNRRLAEKSPIHQSKEPSKGKGLYITHKRCWSLCVYIHRQEKCIYIHRCICIHRCIYIHRWMYVRWMCVYTPMYIHRWMYVRWMCVYTPMYVCTCENVYTYIGVYTHIHRTYSHHTYIHRCKIYVHT